MTCDGGEGRRPQHEVVEVFVEGDKGARREHQCQEAHAAEGNIGDQHHAGEADLVAAEFFAAAAQVLGESAVDAVADPLEGGSSGGKLETTQRGSSG